MFYFSECESRPKSKFAFALAKAPPFTSNDAAVPSGDDPHDNRDPHDPYNSDHDGNYVHHRFHDDPRRQRIKREEYWQAFALMSRRFKPDLLVRL